MKMLSLWILITSHCLASPSLIHTKVDIDRDQRDTEQVSRMEAYATYLDEVITLFELGSDFSFNPDEDIREAGADIYSETFHTDELVIKMFVNNYKTGESCEVNRPTVYNNIYLTCTKADGTIISLDSFLPDSNDNFNRAANL